MEVLQTRTDAELDIKRGASPFCRMNYVLEFTSGWKGCQEKSINIWNYGEAIFLESPANPNRDAMPCTTRLPP